MNVNVAICCLAHIYAEGLYKLLEDDEDINVLGGGNIFDIKDLKDMRPDVILTDLTNCRKIMESLLGSEKKSVLLINDKKVSLDGADLRSMIADGLGGVLTWDSDSRILRKAIKKLNQGELWVDRQTMKEIFDSKKVSKKVQLTKKEMEILECICEGLTNKEIANKLFICEQTVKSHCNHLFKKFGVTSRLKLAVSAPSLMPSIANLH